MDGSERALQRRSQGVLGRTPIAFVQGLSIEQAIGRFRPLTKVLKTVALRDHQHVVEAIAAQIRDRPLNLGWHDRITWTCMHLVALVGGPLTRHGGRLLVWGLETGRVK